MELLRKFAMFFMELLYAPKKGEQPSEIWERWTNYVTRTSINRLTIEITLTTGNLQYLLNQYQRLNGTKLVRILCPQNTTQIQSPSNKVIAAAASYTNAYITLLDVNSNKVVDDISLSDFVLGANFFAGFPGYFLDRQDIDYTKSYIRYPDNTRPAADTGKSILVEIWYKQNC